MMLPSSRQARQRARAAFVTLLAALAATPGVARCQAVAADPVDQLRQVLQSPAPAADRDRATKQCIDRLRTVAELRRALTLTEWRDRNPEGTFGSVDLANHAVVAERFQQTFRQIFARHEATSSVVAISMLADMANTAHAAGERASYLRPFGPDLADLVVHAPPKVQVVAARTLGLIEPDLTAAGPTLGNLLHATDPNLRCAAADGLFEWLQGAVAAAIRDGSVARASGSRTNAVAVACVVLPAVGKGLTDWHVEVRRRCVATLGAAAAALARFIPEPSSGIIADGTDLVARIRTEREELRPLAQALRDQGPALTKALRDGDTDVRLLTQRALEEVADARTRWLRHGGPGFSADDPLFDGLTASLPALSEAATDGDLRVRRAALDVLGVLGPAAAPATPALIKALRDSDRFVRWSAVRTLGAIGPSAARTALPGLTLLLEDDDTDVRKAAAETIKLVSPGASGSLASGSPRTSMARTALPALVRSIRASDPEMRVAAIQTLRGMGSDMKPALPALRDALADSDARVRQAAAEALGVLGPLAREAADDLRGAMADSTPEVRQAAGEALLNVLRASSH